MFSYSDSSRVWINSLFCGHLSDLVLPCKSPKADPGLAIPSAPAANFLKLVSLELGRGLDADE